MWRRWESNNLASPQIRYLSTFFVFYTMWVQMWVQKIIMKGVIILQLFLLIRITTISSHFTYLETPTDCCQLHAKNCDRGQSLQYFVTHSIILSFQQSKACLSAHQLWSCPHHFGLYCLFFQQLLQCNRYSLGCRPFWVQG